VPAAVVAGAEPARVGSAIVRREFVGSLTSSRFSFPPALDGRDSLRSLPDFAPRRSGVADTSRDSVCALTFLLLVLLGTGALVVFVVVVFFLSGLSGAGHSTS
jgi:hypothetical protein